MPYGTLQIADAFLSNQQTVLNYGEQRLVDDLVNPSFIRHNNWVNQLRAKFCESGTDFLRSYGEVGGAENEEMNQQSRPDASKVDLPIVNIGFPVRRFGSSVQWTRDYLRVLSVGEFAKELEAHAQADRRRVFQQIKTAIFKPTNNLTYQDQLPSRRTNKIVLPLLAFYNADGQAVPAGPNGESFDGTHQHYVGRVGGSLASSDIKTLINNVLEHNTEGVIELYINLAQEDAIRAMTGAGEFVPYVDARIHQSLTATYAIGDTLNVRNAADRTIGIFGAAEVIVKPWMPANYIAAIDVAGPKPLYFRIPEDDPSLGNFDIRAEDEKYPLRARTLARDFGVSVLSRGKGAVLYTGGTSYVQPTLTL